MDNIKNLMNNNKFLRIISIILVVAIVITSVIGIAINVIGGEKIDCEQVAADYNNAKPDFSSYFTSMSEDEMTKRLDKIDAELVSIIAMVDIDELIYTDEVATLVARFTSELIGKEFADVKFRAMRKTFPDAYAFVSAQKEAGKTWADLGTIPFGIEKGDKEAFIKACGAGAEAFGKNLLKVMLNAPSSYNDALVPALESIHTGPMPTLVEFVQETGLSGSKRMELMVGKILSIIEPLKTAPLTYLCEIAPDFFKNYTKAAELLNSKKGVEKRAHLVMPTIDGLLNEVLTKAGLSAPALDINKVVSMGTASVDASGANKGQRVRIDGDREVVFSYFASYILETLAYGNNFDLVVKLMTKDLKTDAVQNSIAGEVMNSDMFKVFLSDFVDLLSKIQGRTAPDVKAEVEAYNAENKDFSDMFKWPSTRENVADTIATLDGIIIGSLSDFNIEGLLFTDSFATMIAKITGPLSSKEISDLTFNELRLHFPAAYEYMMAAQAEGKTWKDIGTIPFGITPGDREMFIKACAAGSEHFGDALALCLLVAPTSYEQALVPVVEALHVGPMPEIKDFILATGLSGAERMELLIEKILKITDTLYAAPLTYLCEMLPDLIASYTRASNFAQANPNILAKAGINLMPIGELLNSIVGDMGIKLPEFDFIALTKYGTARVGASGDIGGERFEIIGDKEAVFVAMKGYISDVLTTEGNMVAISTVLSKELGMDPESVNAAVSILEKIVIAIDGLDIPGKLAPVTDAIGGLVAA
ncbi:MAG: hypothetical protein IIX36_06870 [Clostridia bacterium]|nr:hypothetical protein [Clostridia bacterium]